MMGVRQNKIVRGYFGVKKAHFSPPPKPLTRAPALRQALKKCRVDVQKMFGVGVEVPKIKGRVEK